MTEGSKVMNKYNIKTVLKFKVKTFLRRLITDLDLCLKLEPKLTLKINLKGKLPIPKCGILTTAVTFSIELSLMQTILLRTKKSHRLIKPSLLQISTKMTLFLTESRETLPQDW